MRVVISFLFLWVSACSDDPVLLQTQQASGNEVIPASDQSTDQSTDQSSDQVNVETAGNVSNSDVDRGSDSNNSLTQSPTSDYSAAAAAITEVVLVTGQSNALGADTSYDASLDVPHPRAFAFTDEGWRVADLNQVWDLGWQPRNDPDTDPSNNFGFHFARKVAARRPDRVIGFILITAPGEGISHWDYESDFYLKVRDKVIRALNELPNKATIDGILWHQGER